MKPEVTVVIKSFPESNGRKNWTAMLVRTEPWDGLIGNCGGITLARGEFWNRVAFAAERTKFLLGERTTEPNSISYVEDITDPSLWKGETLSPRNRK